MNYYRIVDDLDLPNRWSLGEVDFDDEFDFWSYIQAGTVQEPSKELSINISDEGIPLEFTMAGFELIVVNEKAAALFKKNEVQLVPVKIGGLKSSSKHYILVIKHELDCIDKNKSDYDLW
jgi:hypothetical protein